MRKKGKNRLEKDDDRKTRELMKGTRSIIKDAC